MKKIGLIFQKAWDNKKNILVYGIITIGLLLIAFWAIFPTYSPPWTGFDGYTKSSSNIERAKTLWDWMNLLIVPLVLAIGAWYLNKTEKNVEQKIAQDRLQEERLQKYFDQMTSLLLNNQLRQSNQDSEARSIARSITLATARGLDSERKKILIKFIYESQLIDLVGVVDLSGIDLSNTNLEHVKLRLSCLPHANFSNSNLAKASFSNSNLQRANFRKTQLYRTSFVGADLYMSDFSNSNATKAALADVKLSFSTLDGCIFSEAHLGKADLSNSSAKKSTFRKAFLENANLQDVDFTGADLSGANLRFANLRRAKLHKTNLTGADLHGADFRLADLTGAKVALTELKDSLYDLCKMPNGKINA
jgi:uncharacterized protein YjbI with pentapeptide repeats